MRANRFTPREFILTASVTDRGFLTAWLLLIIAVLFIHLGGYPLLDSDEGRNGEVAREMAATNDYVMPRLDALPYLDKPIVFFAAAAACMEVLGPTETAARLPALLFTLGTAALLAWFARRVGIDWRATGIVFLATPLTLAFSRTVIFDSALTLFITIAIVAFFEAAEDRRPRLSTAVAWAAMGLGVITKGPVALAVPLMIAVPYAIWRKRARFLVSVSALIAFVVVVAPWVWAITRVVPDFLHYVLFTETATRLATGALKRTGPPWYFIPFLIGGAFPWCFGLLRTWDRLSRRSEPAESRLYVYLVLWIGVPFLFFSLSQSKRPQYILPLMAPIALLVARNWFESRRASRATAIASIAFGVVLIAAVSFVKLRIEYADAARITAIAVGACALVGGAIALATRSTIALAALTLPVIAIPIAANPLLNAIAIHRSTKALVAQLPSADEVIGLQAFSGSMAFYLQRPIILVSPNGDEFTSNYLKSHYTQFAMDDSTLRPFDWLPHAFDHARPRLIIVRTTDRSNRAIAERSGARLVATSARFVAYTMPR
jgi:4-amino-4-deoxy-L-arabinose transferase-like glycosyltransferase